MKNCDKQPPCGRHSSEQLQALFRKRPYQGQNPESAKYVFLSLDANLSNRIKTRSAGFREFQAYLTDGVRWWENARGSRTHTPLLVPELRKDFGSDGIRFHQKFRQLFDELRQRGVHELPKKVSFIELLPYLTYGRTSKCRPWYLREIKSCVDHLKWLDGLITNKDKLVFVAVGVFRILEEDLKDWGKLFIGVPQGLKFNHEQNLVTTVPLGNGKLHVHTHFSSAVSNATIAEIAKLILKSEGL